MSGRPVAALALASATVSVLLAGCQGSSAVPAHALEAFVSTSSFISQPGSQIQAIDLTTGKHITSITTGALPSAFALSDSGHQLLVANRGVDTLSLVNTGTDAVTSSLSTGLEPDGVAVTAGAHPTAVVTDYQTDTVTLFNLSTRKAFDTLPVGFGPSSVAIYAGGDGVAPEALVTNLTGNCFTPIDLQTDTSENVVGVGNEPDAIAIAHQRNGTPLALVANFGDNTVTPVDLHDNLRSRPIKLGEDPTSIEVSPDSSAAWVTDGNRLTEISVNALTVTKSITLPGEAEAVALVDQGRKAWVALLQGKIVEVDLSSDTVIKTIHVGGRPSAIAVTQLP